MGSIPLLLIFAAYVLNPVTLSLYPQFATQPGAFRVRAIIERHADNRRLVLRAVQDDTFNVRVTVFQIDGAQSQRVFTPANKCICWFDLPAGEYTAIAELVRVESGVTKTFRSQQPFRVIGGMSSEP